MPEDKQHRLHVNINTETYEAFKDTIPWGLRNTLIIAVIKIVIDAVRQDGMMVVGAVLSGKYKLVIDRDEESGS